MHRPLYIIGPQSDSMAPVKTNARYYYALISESDYYELGGKEAIEEVKKSDPVYVKDAFSVDRHKVHAEVIRLTDQFFRGKACY